MQILDLARSRAHLQQGDNCDSKLQTKERQRVQKENIFLVIQNDYLPYCTWLSLDKFGVCQFALLEILHHMVINTQYDYLKPLGHCSLQ